jgi:hypothetical protein
MHLLRIGACCSPLTKQQDTQARAHGIAIALALALFDSLSVNPDLSFLYMASGRIHYNTGIRLVR